VGAVAYTKTGRQAGTENFQNSRFADTLLARQQNDLAFTFHRPLPSFQKEANFVLPAHKRRQFAGSANSCRRTARFGVSPVTASSCVAPSPRGSGLTSTNSPPKTRSW